MKLKDDMKTALELAESSEWSALDRLITAQCECADDMDDFGMMPLHWACTDTHVPLRVIKKLVDIAPSALLHKNKGGLLPLHIAVKAATKLEVLYALVHASPDVAKCVFEETPTGETPIELARTYQLTHDKITFFLDMEHQLRLAGKAPDRPSARFQAFATPFPTGTSYETSSSPCQESLQSTYIDQDSRTNTPRNVMNAVRLPDGLATVPLPPRWRLDKRCNICQLKFTYFKTRHHCRSCGESVCSTHSNKRFPLHHLRLKTPQRVCILCYDDLREHGTPVAAVCNLYGHNRGPNSVLLMESKEVSMDVLHGATRPPLRSIHSSASLPTTSCSRRESISEGLFEKELPSNLLSSNVLPDKRSGCNTRDEEGPVLTINLPFQDDLRSMRPRAWTASESTEKYHEMQDQQRELASHVQELVLVKTCLEKQLEATTRLALDAKKERHAVDRNVAQLRQNRVIDINRISLDEDNYDDEEIHEVHGKNSLPEFTRSFMLGKHTQLSLQVEKSMELIEDMDVNVADTCNSLGQVYLDRCEFPNAVTEFRKSIDANRKDGNVWVNLARALHGAGDFYDAEIAIHRAMALTSKNYACLSMWGKILHSKGEHDKAVEIFREALSLMEQEEESDEDVGSMTVGW